ncbi:uncharacterized protein [Lepisosteus oculatus]|uniref:uncharacterized protein n=1 Tax=Lepisosteus oculatus TaxID=7918 RepID=UPI0035F529F8
MADPTPAGGRLRRWKPRLIEVLSSDPDFVLQHAQALSLLSDQEYRRIKALGDPSEKVRDLLDCVLDKGQAPCSRLVELLQDQSVQDTYPRLSFLTEEPEEEQLGAVQTKAQLKRKIEDVTSGAEEKPGDGVALVSERQLMQLASQVGHEWKQVGRLLLGLPSARLEHCAEENPHAHCERVFAMLRAWRTREKRGATAARLHALLSQDGSPLHPEAFDFLLEPS